MQILKKIEAFILNIEYALVVILLMSMCLLAFSEVVMRNLYSFSFVWSSVVVRMEVLWVAIFGASIATSERGHIHIDLYSRILPKPYNEYLDAALSLVASVVCLFLFIMAIGFVSVEKEVGNVIHILHTPEWVFTLIFPIGFALMTFKFFLCFLTDVDDVRNGRVRGKRE